MLVCECVCVRWCVPGAWTRSSLGIYVEARVQAQVQFALPFDTTSLIGTWGSPKRLCWPAKEFLEILLHSPSPSSELWVLDTVFSFVHGCRDQRQVLMLA